MLTASTSGLRPSKSRARFDQFALVGRPAIQQACCEMFGTEDMAGFASLDARSVRLLPCAAFLSNTYYALTLAHVNGKGTPLDLFLRCEKASVNLVIVEATMRGDRVLAKSYGGEARIVRVIAINPETAVITDEEGFTRLEKGEYLVNKTTFLIND